MRVLWKLAKHRRRQLADHDAAAHTGDTAPAGCGRDLEQAAGRTKANVAAAEPRRHYRPPECDS
jgi:hypothetical protein